MSLRQIRAIPHNAILQQLGYPVNVLAGAGTAAKDNIEAIAELINNSPRGRQLVRLLDASNARASIKTLAAYGDLFNCAYWASRPYRGTESPVSYTHLDVYKRQGQILCVIVCLKKRKNLNNIQIWPRILALQIWQNV